MQTYSNVPAAAVPMSDFFDDVSNIANGIYEGIVGKGGELLEKLPDKAAEAAEKEIDKVFKPDEPRPDTTTVTPNPNNNSNGYVVTGKNNDFMNYLQNPYLTGGVALAGSKIAGLSWTKSILIGAGTALAVPFVIKKYSER